MKKILLGAVAALAMAAPGMAAADTNAVVGLQYTSIDAGGGDNLDVYGLNGGFSHDFSGNTFLQADGATNRLDAGGCCYSSGYAALHYGLRTDSHSLAGFVGLVDHAEGFSGWLIGAEGQLFFSNVVLNGAVSYEDTDDANLTATNVRADGTYFFTPNFGVNALVSYTNADESGSEDWTTWGLGAEWRFSGGPASVEIGYRSSDFLGDNLDAWTIGLNIDLGTGSLQERAKSGPSLNGARSAYENLGIIL